MQRAIQYFFEEPSSVLREDENLSEAASLAMEAPWG